MDPEERPTGCLLCPKHGNIPIDHKVVMPIQYLPLLPVQILIFLTNILEIFRMLDYCPNLFLHTLVEYTARKQQV